MRLSILLLCTFSASASLISAAPTTPSNKRYLSKRDNGVLYNVFEHEGTGLKLEFVQNSGICETTPGVNQYSGYLSVDDMNIFFWFFEARQNPSTAPLAAWFAGGPGVSSMTSAFINGPCRFEANSSNALPANNTFSFNNHANLLFIDQPINVGYSYGNGTVNSTENAAPYVWSMLQAFYSSFPEYQSRDFGIFTESYGGHYGPKFAKHILDQNVADAGEKINLVALGINNGWFDAAVQMPSYVTFSYNNTYRPLISKARYDSLMQVAQTECIPALEQCAKTGSDAHCVAANTTCYTRVEGPIYDEVYFDAYDIREGFEFAGPDNSKIQPYLERREVRERLGARIAFEPFSEETFYAFAATGDTSLSDVVSSGVTTLIWGGDADWKCNWFGNLNIANLIEYPDQPEFARKPLIPYMVNGNERGTFKTKGNLPFLRAYQAGHSATWYQPELALQAFTQTMMKTPIVST